MTRLGLILAALALTFAASPATAGVPKSPEDFFGIVKGGAPFDGSDLNRMESTNVGSVRFLLAWGPAQPTPDPPNWSDTDRLVGDLASHGMRPFPFVFGSPGWVTKRPSDPPIGTKSARQSWRQFLADAVKRYGPGGDYWAHVYPTQHPGAKALPIRAWQIWNEPNLPGYFSPKPSPSRYGKLLKISHDAIKSQDRGAKIVLAGMPGYGAVIEAWKFLDRLYRVHGIKRDFDAVALHPYSRSLHQLRQELMRMRRVMGHRGDAHTALWITEIGWGSARSNGSLSRGLKGQKRLLQSSFNLLRDVRHKWHIQRVLWYDWRDSTAFPPPSKCGFCPTAGLLRESGKPKPAFHAFKRFTR